MRGSVGKSHLSLPGRLPSLATIKHHSHRRHSQCHHHHRHHLWFSNMSSHCITLQANLVTLDCQVIKIVMTSGSGQNCNQRASRDYSFLSFRFPIQELFATFAIPSDLKGLNFFLLTSAVKPGVAFSCLWHPERKKSCSTWKKCLHLMARSSQSQELLLSSELRNWN